MKLDKPHKEQDELHFSPFYGSMERSILAAVNTLGVTPSTVTACKSDLIVTQLRYLQVCHECNHHFSSLFSFIFMYFFFGQFALNVLLGEGVDNDRSVPHVPSHLVGGREHSILMLP